MDTELMQNEMMKDLQNRLESSFAFVQKVVPVAYWYENLNENGRIKDIYYSDQMRTMLGYKSEQEFPNTLDALLNVIHPDDRNVMLDNAIAAGTGKISKLDVQYRIRKADGQYIWCNVTGQVVKDADGRTVGMYGAFIDITPQVELRKRLENENYKLVENLLKDYNIVYKVNLLNASYSLLKMDEGIIGKGMEFSDFTEARRFFIEDVAYHNDRPMLRHELDFETIRKRAGAEESYSVDYRAVVEGVAIWHEMIINYLGEDEVAIGFAVKDAEILNRHISKALIDNYDAIYVANLDTDQMKVLKASGIMMGKPEVVSYSKLLKEYASGLSGDARKYFEEASDLEFGKKKLGKEGRSELVYRSPYYGGEFVWLKSETSVLTYVDGVPETIVITISRVDSLQQEKIELHEQLKTALDNATEEKNRLAVSGEMINSANWSFVLDENDQVADAGFYGEPLKVMGTDLTITPHAWETLLHPDDKEKALADFNAAIKDRTGKVRYDVQYRLRDKDGQYNWFRSAGKVIEQPDGTREFFGILVNINDRIQAQETRIREAEESKSLIESVASIYRFAFTVDMTSGLFRIIRLEDTVKSKLNITEVRNYREAVAPLFEMLHPSDRALMENELDFNTIKKRLEDCISYNIEYRILVKETGATSWHEMNVTHITGDEIAMGFGEKDLDITKRHLEENRFSEYFALYEADVATERIKIVIDSPYYGIDRSGTSLPYAETLKTFAASLDGEAKAFFRQLSDLKYIKKELSAAGKHAYTYKSPNVENKWVDCTIFVTHREEDGTPSMFTLGFSYIDAFGAARQDLQSKVAEQKTLLEKQQKQLMVALETANIEAQKNDMIINAIHAGKWTYTVSADDEITGASYSDDIEDVASAHYGGRPMGWLDYIHPEDKGRVLREFMAPVFDHSGNTVYDSTYRLKSGKGNNDFRWFRSAGRVIRHADGSGEFTGMAMDLTDQIALQEKLARRTAISDYFLKTYVTAYYVDLNSDQALILHSDNDKPSAPLVGKTLPISKIVSKYINYIHPDDREEFAGSLKSDFMRKQVGDGKEYNFVYRNVSKDAPLIYRCTIMPGDDKNHVAVGFRDITGEVRQQEERQNELQKALTMAQAANKAKTDFLFNMSHDIRTPMNAILGYTNMAEKHIDNKEKVMDCLEKTQESGNLLLHLINSVLDVSRIESGNTETELQAGDVYYSFANIESTLQEEAKKKDIALSFEFGEIKDRYVLADFTRCLRVFTNLISNSIKYTQPGGYVKVRCRQAAPKKDGEVLYEYTVEDNGMGMSEEFQQHMFEAFSREHNSTTSGIQGTGLGLSVCKSFVDYLGGTIECSSRPGEGTVFTVLLPFSVQEGNSFTDPVTGELKSGREKEAVSLEKFTGKRVLLVEDNDMNREIALDILEEEGLIVEEAEDGDIAVEMVKSHAGKGEESYYDFILMDIQMPRMNGLDAARAIRAIPSESNTRIPIIAVSANAFEEDRKASLEAGMDPHIAKPINIRELFSVLAKFL